MKSWLGKVSGFAVAVLLATSGAVMGGAIDPGHKTIDTSTTTTTNSTSSSTSNSTTYSNTVVNEGDIYLGYTVSGTAYNTAHPDATLYTYAAELATYPSTLELLTNGPTGFADYFYYDINGAYWSTGGGYVEANGYFGYATDPADFYTQVLGGRGYVDNAGCVDYTGQSTYALCATAGGPTTVTQQVTQQTTQQVSVTNTTYTVDQGCLGCYTVDNTNTNTNTNVNTNTNTNSNYSSTTYEGTGVVDNYSVNSCVWVSPIVLDLSGTGKLDASAGKWLPHPGMQGTHVAMFDIRGNGMDMMMEWVGPQAGLLCEPKADGTVDGTCLFGTTGGFRDGFQKLALRDKNHDGKLSGEELNGLYVWVDGNSNGKVDAGEMKSLEELGITEISLDAHNSVSSFTMNGAKQTCWDWYPTAMDVRREPIAKK